MERKQENGEKEPDKELAKEASSRGASLPRPWSRSCCGTPGLGAGTVTRVNRAGCARD